LFTLFQIVMNGKEGTAFLYCPLTGREGGRNKNQKTQSNIRRHSAMNSKIAKAALAAAALGGLIAASSAHAQSYGGAPECGYGNSWNPVTQSCVSNRDARPDYGRRSYTRRFQHLRRSAHRTHPVRVARNAANNNGVRQ
jgi:hypothetical protein